jgi:putative FmdB family regulatory protein
MPIYEYRCEQGHNFEVMQRMSDDPVVSCETCEAPVQRVFHPVAVHFKGSGFYNTDYGTRKRSRENAEHSKNNGDGAKSGEGSSGEGAKSGEGSSGEGSKSGEGSSEKKTESKSEKKPDTKAAASKD